MAHFVRRVMPPPLLFIFSQRLSLSAAMYAFSTVVLTRCAV